MFDARFSGDKFGEKSQCNEKQCCLGDLEGDNLGGNGRAHVGAENDTDGLLKAHDAGGMKPTSNTVVMEED